VDFAHPNLLFIESSPRDAMSASTAVAQAFVDAWHRKHADGTLDTLDVWDGSLHEFDGAALQAKYPALSGHDPPPEQNSRGQRLRRTLNAFTTPTSSCSRSRSGTTQSLTSSSSSSTWIRRTA